jgi:hypothetical protein
MSFRTEKKFRMSLADQRRLREELLTEGMRPLHPGRWVNSCYFDSRMLHCFHNSEEGVLPRKKVRVRWYNNEHVLSKEIKISSNEGRFKKTEKINRLNLDQASQTYFLDADLGLLRPIIIVRYWREYFSLNSLRLTFDSMIYYCPLRRSGLKRLRDKETVVEVKSPVTTADDYILSSVNLPNERFSKYCRSILLTGLA